MCDKILHSGMTWVAAANTVEQVLASNHTMADVVILGDWIQCCSFWFIRQIWLGLVQVVKTGVILQGSVAFVLHGTLSCANSCPKWVRDDSRKCTSAIAHHGWALTLERTCSEAHRHSNKSCFVMCP